MAADSKQRMIRSAYQLFRERGYSGTGFREINAHSGVARGAIYHHFPGGKTQLAEEVIKLSGTEIGDALEEFASSADPVATISAFVAGWEQHLREYEFRAGCAIAAVMGESQHEAPQLADAAAAAFSRWRAILAGSLNRAGVPPTRGQQLATLAVSAVEGAVVLARAERSTNPLKEVGRELQALFADAAAKAEPPGA